MLTCSLIHTHWICSHVLWTFKLLSRSMWRWWCCSREERPDRRKGVYVEFLDIVDDHGLPTGQVVERREAHAGGIPHRTSHVWLLRKHNGKTEILLQKRCEAKDSFPGCYDISSAGHIPAGDDFVPSAIRELKEELGLDAAGEDLIFCGDRSVVRDDEFRGKPFHDRQYSRVFALWCDRAETGFRLQAEEVSAVKWMVLDCVIDAVEEGTIPNCIDPEELKMVKAAISQHL